MNLTNCTTIVAETDEKGNLKGSYFETNSDEGVEQRGKETYGHFKTFGTLQAFNDEWEALPEED